MSEQCLVCESQDPATRFRLRSPYLGGEPEYEFRECAACGLLFAYGPTDEDTLRRVYDEAFHSSSQQTAPVDASGEWSAEALKMPVVANAIRRADWLHELGLHGRLLDVGCGRAFSTKAQAAHFDARGIELSSSAVAFATSMGVDVVAGDILTADYPAESFDVITMWDALSSMTQPQALATKLSDLLKPGGTLVLTAPDPESRMARVTGRYWPMLVPPVNLGYYPIRCVQALLEPVGCAIMQTHYEAKRVSLDFAARKLLRTVGLRAVAEGIPAAPPQWALPLNLGDIVTVVAKKAGG